MSVPDAEKLEALRAFALDIATTAEAAVSNHHGPKTGMRAPYHGDFAACTPSTAAALEKWARAARFVLALTASAPGCPIASESDGR